MKFKCGRCEAAVFENQTERNGATVKTKKVTFQKKYRSSDGTWKTTYSLDANEIPKAVLVLTKAYEYLVFSEDSGEAGPGTA
jgi:hypothetical protein